MRFWITFQSLLSHNWSSMYHSFRATKINDGFISASLLSHTCTHTHLSACSDIALSYPRTKHHTTTVPQFCVTEGPQFYSSEWWNFLTGTVLCGKTIMPIVSWEGTMTLLQFCVEELQHYCCAWQNYHISVCVCVCVWEIPQCYSSVMELPHSDSSRELLHCNSVKGTTTLLQFCVLEQNFYNSV
jgi:hypothetical protein